MHDEDILVVDDNPGSLKLARVLLQKHGYRVSTARDAREALQHLQSGPPHLILLDLQLPGLDGYELARRLKADENTRAIPIVALTAYAMRGDKERAQLAGCDDYVTKPLDTRALPKLIADRLQRAAGRASSNEGTDKSA